MCCIIYDSAITDIRVSFTRRVPRVLLLIVWGFIGLLNCIDVCTTVSERIIYSTIPYSTVQRCAKCASFDPLSGLSSVNRFA